MSPQSVACQGIIARGVDPECLRRSAPVQVRKSAFIPRAKGQDNDGLSVSLVGEVRWQSFAGSDRTMRGLLFTLAMSARYPQTDIDSTWLLTRLKRIPITH